MYPNHEFVRTPELSVSDSEDSCSSSDEEMPDREETDLLLRQAHHYVITEGGQDSPSTYIARIQRIHRSLIQEIARHSYDCDPKLYRRVRQKVDHVLREFEDAVGVETDVHDHNELPEYYTAAAGQALCRSNSEPMTPDSPSTRLHPERSSKTDSQKTYLYGGPDNHPEIWYQKAAGLPFPETIRMAEWESLRIHWDIAITGDTQRTKPIAGNGISFNDPRLERLNRLPQYESGSRFRLPAVDPADRKVVNDFCTVAKLTKAVDAFSQTDESVDADGRYGYAPRVCLDRLKDGSQARLTDIVDDVREALNSTPTRLHPTSASESSHTVDHEHYDHLSSAVSPHTSTSHLLTSSPDSSPLRNNGASSAIRYIEAATEESVRSSQLSKSPPLASTTDGLPTKRLRGHPRDYTLPASAKPRATSNQSTASGKRKRLSVDTVEAEAQRTAGVESHLKRARTSKEPARPYTPIMATQSDSLHTPVFTPALTIGSVSASSVASTPPVVKARTAGKKQKKIRTKKDFEERVTPEKYAEIMAHRRANNARDHEDVVRGSTRSGKLRVL